jgi:hypothetical protein
VTKAPDNLHYLYGDSVQLTALPGTGWSFSAWSGDISGSVSPRTIIINGTTTITATFVQNAYTLTIDIVGSGSVNRDPDKGSYNFGDSVQLTANPAAHWSFAAWSGGISGSVNPRTITINGTTTVTATFTWNAPAVTVYGAYHGARLSWSDVGALSYKIYYNTVNNPDTATLYASDVTGTTYDVKNLPDTTWDETCYYWIAAVGAGGEAPEASWGMGSDKVWIYKVEITSVELVRHVVGNIEVRVHFQSRYLDGPVTVELELGEYLGPGTGTDVPNRPITITTSGPSVLVSFMSTGQFSFGSTNSEFAPGSSYKAWIFLWNRLPSEPGYWEAYSAKYELIPITIP